MRHWEKFSDFSDGILSSTGEVSLSGPQMCQIMFLWAITACSITTGKAMLGSMVHQETWRPQGLTQISRVTGMHPHHLLTQTSTYSWVTLSSRPEDGCELTSSGVLARCCLLSTSLSPPPHPSEHHLQPPPQAFGNPRLSIKGFSANQRESFLLHLTSLLLLTCHEHIPELLSLQRDSISPHSPHTLILSFANSLAWNNRCLPIKTFSTECWHLEINRKALDRQLILISSCSEFLLQFVFKMSIHSSSREIRQTCSTANKKTTSHFACQTTAQIGSEISQHT